MKFGMRKCIVINGEHAIFITSEDLQEINSAVFDTNGDKFSMYDAIIFMSKNTDIYYRGKQFGFSDTEVKDEIHLILRGK